MIYLLQAADAVRCQAPWAQCAWEWGERQLQEAASQPEAGSSILSPGRLCGSAWLQRHQHGRWLHSLSSRMPAAEETDWQHRLRAGCPCGPTARAQGCQQHRGWTGDAAGGGEIPTAHSLSPRKPAVQETVDIAIEGGISATLADTVTRSWQSAGHLERTAGFLPRVWRSTARYAVHLPAGTGRQVRRKARTLTAAYQD